MSERPRPMHGRTTSARSGRSSTACSTPGAAVTSSLPRRPRTQPNRAPAAQRRASGRSCWPPSTGACSSPAARPKRGPQPHHHLPHAGVGQHREPGADRTGHRVRPTVHHLRADPARHGGHGRPDVGATGPLVGAVAAAGGLSPQLDVRWSGRHQPHHLPLPVGQQAQLRGGARLAGAAGDSATRRHHITQALVVQAMS
jgi:hypothetical protein